MRNTDPLYGLSEMLEYLDGLGSSTDRIDDARAGLHYLKTRGFRVVHQAQPPVIRSASPEDLKATRNALRVTNRRLADEAGLSINAVIKAQAPGASSRQRTTAAVVSALVRLGAHLPPGSDCHSTEDA